MTAAEPSSGVFVRGVAVEDAPSLFKLCHDLGYAPAKEGFHGRLNALTGDPNHALFVAVNAHDDVVGFVHVFGRHAIEIEPCAQIQALVVGERDRRSGAARLLTGAAEEWAKARGFTWVSLYCSSHRDDAHRFYEAAGFDGEVTATRFNKRLDGDA